MNTIITILFTFICLISFSQANTIYSNDKRICDQSTIRHVSESLPVFTGNSKQLHKEINKRVGKTKKLSSVTGKGYIQMIITCKGDAVFNKLLRGVDSDLDQMIIDALKNAKSFQNWDPAVQRGVKYDSFYTIPYEVKKGKKNKISFPSLQ